MTQAKSLTTMTESLSTEIPKGIYGPLLTHWQRVVRWRLYKRLFLATFPLRDPAHDFGHMLAAEEFWELKNR